MKRILVVDDNLAALKHTAAQLEGKYRVMLAKSGAQALDVVAREAPDLIILDIEMPDMDGFETIGHLRSGWTTSRIPVIFLTGNHDAKTQVRALEAGGVDFIKKPFERGVLLHRIGLHLSLFEYQQNLESNVKNLEDTILLSFADLIERRNGNSGNHSWRSVRFIELLGRLLIERELFPDELDEMLLELMVRASTLHDIGKIGISDTILLKPDKLTQEEFEEVKKHTLIGARALANMYKRTPAQLYLEYARLMAEGHHERYNGSGYPRGLAGDDIPLCCRMLALTNVYDAILSDTVYRPARSHEEARKIIETGAGTEFDPVIVEVFTANYDKFARIALAASEDGLR